MEVHYLAFSAWGDGDGLCAILMDENPGLVLPDDPITYLEVEGFF